MTDTNLTAAAKAQALINAKAQAVEAALAVKHVQEHAVGAFNLYDEAHAMIKHDHLIDQAKSAAYYQTATDTYEGRKADAAFDKERAAKDAIVLQSYVGQMTTAEATRYHAMDGGEQQAYNETLLKGSTLTPHQKIVYAEALTLYSKYSDSNTHQDKHNFVDSLYRLGREPLDTQVAVGGKLIYHSIHGNDAGLAANVLAYLPEAKNISFVTSPAIPGRQEVAHRLSDVLTSGMAVQSAPHVAAVDYSILADGEARSMQGGIDHQLKNVVATHYHETEASKAEVLQIQQTQAQRQVLGH